MKLRFLTLLGLLLACERSSPKTGGGAAEVLSGSPSDMLQVVTLVNEDGFQGCSGTLIAPDVVLTAAHCVGPNQKEVYVGYSKPSSQGEPLDVEGGTHKSYRIIDSAAMNVSIYECPMEGVDVGLLRLDAPTDVAPAELAEATPEIGDRCLVVGYGAHKADAGLDLVEAQEWEFTTGERRQANIEIFAKAEAGESPWFSAKGIDGAHSRGDSGGPVLCGGKIAGIVSCSVDRNHSVLDQVKVYANVQMAKTFIDETMRRWRETPAPASDAGR